jgi:3-oxoacyl-[acyl-carrier-protein] synthase III
MAPPFSDAVVRLVGVSKEKVASNIDHYGNTAATSIPLCIAEWYERGKLQIGDRVVLASFGAGFTMSAVYLRWSVAPLATACEDGIALDASHAEDGTTARV